MLGRSVSPPDCALALGIPLTEIEFRQDLESGGKKPLARRVKSYERYQRLVSKPVEHVISEVQQCGVTVYRRTPLSQIPELFKSHPVVTLVAHWEFLLISAADVLDVRRFQSILHGEVASSESRVDQIERPIDAVLRADRAVTTAKTPETLVPAISPYLRQSREYYFSEDEIDNGKRAELSQATFTRVLLEESFPGCFVPGNALELADRLCTAWEFIDAVPKTFDGVLDLTNCNSIILAEALRRKRCGCNAICLTGLAAPNIRITLYKWIIRQLALCPQPYEDAAARTHLALIEEIRRQPEKMNNISSSGAF